MEFLRLLYTFKGLFCPNFLFQIQDFYFIWIFQKNNYFKKWKRERDMHKNEIFKNDSVNRELW